MLAAERFIERYRRRLEIEKIKSARARRAAAARAQYQQRWVIQVSSELYDRVGLYRGTKKSVLESAINQAIDSCS